MALYLIRASPGIKRVCIHKAILQELVIPYGSIDLRGQFAAKPKVRPRTAVKKATTAEALQQADFRNLSFLHRFTSEAGLLPPRRVTKLQKKVHVHVMRQIKVLCLQHWVQYHAPYSAQMHLI